MPTWTVTDAATLLGVSTDTVRRLVDAGKIRSPRARSGRRRVDGLSLAKHLAGRAPAAGPRPQEQSTRNRLPGIVLRVVKDKVAAQVEVLVGPHRIVALVTREAVEALGLEPGMAAVVAVKATNVAVELPKRPTGRRRTD